MTREEAIKEINRVFEPAFANYIITALTEGATISDKALEQEPCEDVVSRSDVRKIAKEMYLEVANMELDVQTISDCISYTSSKCRQVLVDKLNDLTSVTPKGITVTDFADRCRECGARYGKLLKQEPIIDKIRAEIEQEAFKDANGSKYIFVNRVNQIIDKYKAESEEV